MFSLKTVLFIIFLCIVIVGFSYAKTAGYFEAFSLGTTDTSSQYNGLRENIKLN
jgi:hypothetical protein